MKLKQNILVLILTMSFIPALAIVSGPNLVAPLKKKIIKTKFRITNPKTIKEKKKALDNWLRAKTGSEDIPTSAVIVIHRNEIAYKKAINTKLSRMYPIASFTKIFVSLAVLQLVDRGMISLDDPISKHLEVTLENKDIKTDPITFRHLLVHTSGIIDKGKYRDAGFPFSVPEQRFSAGIHFWYSNSGYNILGHAVVAISGASDLGSYITDNLLIPMEMDRCEAPRGTTGSGGMKCSVKDLGTLVKIFISDGKYKDKQIISKKMYYEYFKTTVKFPLSKNKTFRGIAWNVWTERGQPISMLHGSLWKGSGGLIRIFPEIKAGFVFMSNPPNHKNREFVSFFNILKGRIVRLISQLRIEGSDPLKFRATYTGKSEIKHFIGKYKDPVKNKLIEITVKNEKQLAWKYNKSSGEIRLRPFSTINYVYYSKGDSLPFDFIWEKDRIVALIVKYTYYKKL